MARRIIDVGRLSDRAGRARAAAIEGAGRLHDTNVEAPSDEKKLLFDGFPLERVRNARAINAESAFLWCRY